MPAQSHMTGLAAQAQAAFSEQYSTAPSHVARAPGRINIIGEHTDYNDGFVLPAAIQQAIYVAGKLRSDNTVKVQSLDFRNNASFTLDQLKDDSLPHWTQHVRGVLWVLREKGHKFKGMDLTITSDVPRGGGFSSSAAIEVAMFERS